MLYQPKTTPTLEFMLTKKGKWKCVQPSLGCMCVYVCVFASELSLMVSNVSP